MVTNQGGLCDNATSRRAATVTAMIVRSSAVSVIPRGYRFDHDNYRTPPPNMQMDADRGSGRREAVRITLNQSASNWITRDKRFETPWCLATAFFSHLRTWDHALPCRIDVEENTGL